MIFICINLSPLPRPAQGLRRMKYEILIKCPDEFLATTEKQPPGLLRVFYLLTVLTAVSSACNLEIIKLSIFTEARTG